MNCFIMVMVMAEPLLEPCVQGKKYTQDGTSVQHRAPHTCTLSLTPTGNPPYVLGSLENNRVPWGKQHGHGENMENSKQIVNRAEDQTPNPGVVRQQCYLLQQHTTSYTKIIKLGMHHKSMNETPLQYEALKTQALRHKANPLWSRDSLTR